MRLRHAAGQADGQQDCGMRVEWGIGVGNLAGGRWGGAQNPLIDACPCTCPRPACSPVWVGQRRMGGGLLVWLTATRSCRRMLHQALYLN